MEAQWMKPKMKSISKLFQKPAESEFKDADEWEEQPESGRKVEYSSMNIKNQIS